MLQVPCPGDGSLLPYPQRRTPGAQPWIGYLTSAENLMEENPKGPAVRLDGVVRSGECLWGSPLVGYVVVVAKVDVFLQLDTLCWPPAPLPHPAAWACPWHQP